MNAGRTRFWTRVVADATFAEAVIDDPLRALSDVPDIEVSAEQVRQLEEMSRDERTEFVRGIVREAFFKGASSRYGELAESGLLGAGGDLPPELRRDEDDADDGEGKGDTDGGVDAD